MTARGSRPDALLFDFDGVLLESEFVGNRQIAETLTALGYPTTLDDTRRRFVGLNGADYRSALERWIGGPIPEEFHARQADHARAALAEGLEAVAGAVAFVRSLPADLPRAVASSSSTEWIVAHLNHLDLAPAFGSHIYSGAEHVRRGKPAPDLYWHAAKALGVPIERCAILEDSEVGVRGAVASGARVIGVTAGRHCPADHADALRALGVREIAGGFAEVAERLGLPIAPDEAPSEAGARAGVPSGPASCADTLR